MNSELQDWLMYKFLRFSANRKFFMMVKCIKYTLSEMSTYASALSLHRVHPRTE